MIGYRIGAVRAITRGRGRQGIQRMSSRARFRNAKQVGVKGGEEERSAMTRTDSQGDIVVANTEGIKSEQEIGEALKDVADRARDQVFGNFDVLSNSARPPRTIAYLDSSNSKGKYGRIVLNDGTQIDSGDMVVLWDNECYLIPLPEKDPTSTTSTSTTKLQDAYFSIPQPLINLFNIMFPRPDLVVIGTGGKTRMIDKESIAKFAKLGLAIDPAHSKLAAGNFDLLATERTGRVALCLCPPLY